MTNETKFTPGPWRVGRPTNEYGQTFHASMIYTEDAEHAIAEVYGIPIHARMEQIDPELYAQPLANAHMLAAAPEMYEVCMEIAHHLYTKQDYDRCRELARAAIAKAEGRAAETPHPFEGIWRSETEAK